MKLRLLSSLSLFALALQTVDAQPADDFFHGGAQSYLTNNIPNALTQTEAGLKLYPDDAKLKKLYELLKQQQQSQSQQQQKQNQSQQNQQSQSDEQKKEQQEQQQKQNEQQKQSQQNQKPDQEKQNQQQPEEQQTKPGEMTPQQAKQLLDAEKDDEKLLPVSRAEKPRDRSRPVKDW
jgi:Ca-activated chloride channel family protein